MNGDKERFNGCKAFQKVLDGEFFDLIKILNFLNVLFQRFVNGAYNMASIAILNCRTRRKIAGSQDSGKELSKVWTTNYQQK